MKYEQMNKTHPDWENYMNQITFNLQKLLGKEKKMRKEFLDRNDYASEFIKVPFKDALSLVAGRQVYLMKGYAYVHISDLNVIARTQFKNKMFSELNRAYKFLPTIL